MKIQDSYFVEFANGMSAWLAVGKPVPADATVIEVRPILIPGEGMILRNKETGEKSRGCWLRNGDSADKWEEIEYQPNERVD